MDETTISYSLKRCYGKLRKQLRDTTDFNLQYIRDAFMQISMGIGHGFFKEENELKLANLVMFEPPKIARDKTEEFLYELWGFNEMTRIIKRNRERKRKE